MQFQSKKIDMVTSLIQPANWSSWRSANYTNFCFSVWCL